MILLKIMDIVSLRQRTHGKELKTTRNKDPEDDEGRKGPRVTRSEGKRVASETGAQSALWGWEPVEGGAPAHQVCSRPRWDLEVVAGFLGPSLNPGDFA